MGNILSVVHLAKHYGDVKAVDGVTFFIEQGQIFGLLGPNGAGKTTTINILSQIIKPNSGKVEINGMDLKSHGPAIKQIVGIVPQDIAIYPSLNARENLEFFGGLYGLAGKELTAGIEEALELVGLKDAAKRKAQTYSGGMKRRLNIAAGLLNKPKLLILDEPAVGVDPQSRNHILDSIRKLNREYGISVLYTSHYMEEVQSLCDRAAIIDKGRIIADNTIDDLISRYGVGIILITLDREVGNAAELLAGIVPGDRLRCDGARLNISDAHPQRLLPSVLQKLTDAGLHAVEISINSANLETVFLNLTGRSLRDE